MLDSLVASSTQLKYMQENEGALALLDQQPRHDDWEKATLFLATASSKVLMICSTFQQGMMDCKQTSNKLPSSFYFLLFCWMHETVSQSGREGGWVGAKWLAVVGQERLRTTGGQN